MKAYKDIQGRVRLFRPDMNMKRFKRSCARLALPVRSTRNSTFSSLQTFEEDQVLACIKELVKLDQRWIPAEHGYSLYIRPTMIASQVLHR
jgi:branched-chain amino acid aminotransferase